MTANRSYIKYLRNLNVSHASNIQSWPVPQLLRSYAWPTGMPGGSKIAILELGGGSNVSDMQMFCKMTNTPMPNLTDVSVDAGASNSPGGDADGEVALDQQIIACGYSTATGQPADITTFWANNDLGGITRGVSAAAAAGMDVLSISWGSFESSFGRSAAIALEHAIAIAAIAGMITFVAAGDASSDDGDPTSTPDVDLPAGCPHAIACGGTMRPHSSNQNTNPETVWGNGQANGEGTGGGISQFFPIQTWQFGKVAGAPKAVGRCVPDIAGCADPQTGYEIVLDGQVIVVGGTSAVAPLYAGLFASFGQKLGFIGQTLWDNPGVWRSNIPGSNGYMQPPNPGLCTGLGSPFGNRLAALFVK